MTPLQLITGGFIGVGLAAGTSTIVGASLYDFMGARSQKYLNYHPNKKNLRKPPLISVIVVAHNHEDTIKQCLVSITKSTTRKYEVIVVDSGSTDDTKLLVTKFIKTHPKKSIQLIATRKPGHQAAVASGLRRAKGELVLVLGAGAYVAPDTLKNLVQPFCLSPDLQVLTAHTKTVSQPTVASLVQQFDDATRSQALKLGHLTRTSYAGGLVNSVYRRHTLAKLLRINVLHSGEATIFASFGSKQLRAGYMANALIYNQPAKSYLSLLSQKYVQKLNNLRALSIYRPMLYKGKKNSRLRVFASTIATYLWLVWLLVFPVILGYFTFLAISSHVIFLLGLSWLSFSTFLLLAIWGSEHTRFMKKINQSLLVPIMFGLFYVTALVQFAVFLKLLVNTVKTVGKKFARLGLAIAPTRFKATAKV